MKDKILMAILFFLCMAVWIAYIVSPIDEEFCDSLPFNREICFKSIEETNEEYCESIYWEDKDNCIYFEPGVFTGTPEFCEKIIFESTRKACFKAIQ